MNDETKNGQYPPQQYPQSGNYPPQQYPQSGNYPPQQYPQSGNYPPQQYQQSGNYPPQQYPQSGQYAPQQYQQSQSYYSTDENKKSNSKLWIVLGIIGGAIFLIAIISVLLVQNKHIMEKKAVREIQNATLMDYSQYENLENDSLALVVDGKSVSLPQRMLTINEHSYISVDDFAKVFGYKSKMDAVNKKTTVSSDKRTAVFTQDATDAVITEGSNEWVVTMSDKAYMFTNEQTYVPLRSLAEVFGFKSVEWDNATNTVIVVKK